MKSLPWDKLWYNTSRHSSLGMFPFKVVNVREPSLLPHYSPCASSFDAIDCDLSQNAIIVDGDEGSKAEDEEEAFGNQVDDFL